MWASRHLSALRWAGLWAAAILTRMVAIPLNFPAVPVFDEVYYVPQALALGRPIPGVDMGQRATDIFTAIGGTLPSLTPPEILDTFSAFLHPPIGKFLIMVGALFFPQSDPTGWRISAAVASVLLVVATAAAGQKLSGSPVVGTLAGVFVLVDGQTVAAGRLGMLDIFVPLAAVCAVWCVAAGWHTGRGWLRWVYWVGAGVALGVASGVKWDSVLWFPVVAAGVCATTVVRRRTRAAGVGVVAGCGMLVYTAGWLLSPIGAGERLWARLGTLVAYHRWIYRIMSADPRGQPGSSPSAPYPLNWLLQIGQWTFPSCNADGACTVVMSDVGNPLLWCGFFVAVVALAVMSWRVRSRWGVLCVAMFAVPALAWGAMSLLSGRGVFVFYSVHVAPFGAWALAWGLWVLWRRHPHPWVRAAAAFYVVVTVGVSVSLFHLWAGWGG